MTRTLPPRRAAPAAAALAPAAVAHALAGALALAAAPATANDSTASLDTGEIVLVQSPDIRMDEEDLYLGAGEVRVRYLFHNTAGVPLLRRVAFPLPPIALGWDSAYAISAAAAEDPLGFRLWIDGAPVAVETEARAEALGRDVTGRLRALGLPLTPFAPGAAGWQGIEAAIAALPAADRAALVVEGILLPGGDLDVPGWTVRITHHWLMTFPADRPVEVRHAYAPVPMHGFFSVHDLEAGTFAELACIDAPTAAGIRRRLEAAPSGMLAAALLRYVLTTANNWRGPIGRFRLTVDKGTPEALVSLCLDGLRKTSPKTFVWEATGYVPGDDLAVLFLAPLPE